ncbi:MAG: alpha/beta hydrolase family protein [bacterium]
MKLINHILDRGDKKPILWDAYFNKNSKQKPLVIFSHGYKGFKDWGAWYKVAESFAENDFFFVKFNFSHNGGTMKQPIDFPDLEAFGQNNYSKELDDLDDIINYFTNPSFEYADQIDVNDIVLIGHSRGGGIAIIKASEDSRITKLITWASVSSFGKRTSTTGDLEQWKKDGVKYITNGRTKQQLPHYYQFYEDYIANEERFDIKRCCSVLKIPHLILHGTDDPAVLFREGENLIKWSPHAKLVALEDTDHVFNTRHPWVENSFPKAFLEIINESIAFAKK